MQVASTGFGTSDASDDPASTECALPSVLWAARTNLQVATPTTMAYVRHAQAVIRV